MLLLDDMGQLVAQQLVAVGGVAAAVEHDVAADGVGVRADRLRRRRRRAVVVDPHAAEVVAELLLHAGAHRRHQRLAR